MIKKLLIANRGEIAARIQKSAQKLGIRTVVVYAYPDRFHDYVKDADESYELNGSFSHETYLDQEQLINIACACRAEAIHPGYGFLSENANFARLCRKHNIRFVGPTPEAIDAMGSKSEAKQIAQKAGIPIIESQSAESIDRNKLVMPVLVKAVHGGGGKGMRIVHSLDKLDEAIHAAKREAKQAFGNDEVLIEPYIEHARHIEVQVFGDTFGKIVHLFERDCSLQRKYQKVIEEAPAENLNSAIKDKLFNASIKLAKAVGYVGAGTCEFLVTQDAFYFLEMNTRLQVEHPITEFITNEDLVAWQLIVASGKSLPKKQSEIQCNGHAIELRVTAENTLDGYQPDTGYITKVKWPLNTRVDSYLKAGSKISVYYDSMIAKIISFAETRELAIAAAKNAIHETQIKGIHTNIPFLSALLELKDFNACTHHTQSLEQQQLPILLSMEKHRKAYSAFALWQLIKDSKSSPTSYLFHNVPRVAIKALWVGDGRSSDCFTNVKLLSDGFEEIHENEGGPERILLTVQDHSFFYNNQKFSLPEFKKDDGSVHIKTVYGLVSYNRVSYVATHKEELDKYKIVAPMTAHVAKIHCHEKDVIKKGTPIITLTAMKMEHVLLSPCDTKIKKFYVKNNQVVSSGDILVDFLEDS